MNSVIKGGNAAAMLRITFEKGESLSVAHDTVVACSSGLTFSLRSDGGILTRLARKFSRGNFLYQEVQAVEADQWIMLSPEHPGAIASFELYNRGSVLVDERYFLAATPDVVISRKVKAMEEIGLNSIALSGKGSVFLSGCGAVEQLGLLPGQSILVTTAHLIALDEAVTCHKLPDGMARMTGPGQIWLQTRRIAAASLLTE